MNGIRLSFTFNASEKLEKKSRTLMTAGTDRS